MTKPVLQRLLGGPGRLVEIASVIQPQLDFVAGVVAFPMGTTKRNLIETAYRDAPAAAPSHAVVDIAAAEMGRVSSWIHRTKSYPIDVRNNDWAAAAGYYDGGATATYR